MYQNAVNWINLKSAQERGLIFLASNSNDVILDNSVPADCLQKLVNRKQEKFRITRFVCRHVSHNKVMLKSVWQVRHEGTVKLLQTK